MLIKTKVWCCDPQNCCDSCAASGGEASGCGTKVVLTHELIRGQISVKTLGTPHLFIHVMWIRKMEILFKQHNWHTAEQEHSTVMSTAWRMTVWLSAGTCKEKCPEDLMHEERHVSTPTLCKQCIMQLHSALRSTVTCRDPFALGVPI